MAHCTIWDLLQRAVFTHLFSCLVCLILTTHLPFRFIYSLLNIQIEKKTQIIRTCHFLVFQTHSSPFCVVLKFKWILKMNPFLGWVLVHQCFTLLLCIDLQFCFLSANLPPLNAFWDSYLNSLPFSQFRHTGKKITTLGSLESGTNEIRKGSWTVRADRNWSA